MKKKINLGFRYIKAYKRRSIAIILSIMLCVTMVVGISILSETEKRSQIQEMKYNTGIYHVMYSNVNQDQLNSIESNKNIENVGAKSFYASTSKNEKQLLSIYNSNEDYLIANSKLQQGRFAKEKNEIVAEEWVLINLGLEPKVNQKITLNIEDENGDTRNQEFNIVGIIKDRASEKMAGRKELFLPLDNSQDMEVHVAFDEKIDIASYAVNIANKAKIKKDNIMIMDDFVNIVENGNKISPELISTSLVIAGVAGIVVYSIFNISIYKRFKEYGVLRAVGAKNSKIFKMITNELLGLSAIAIPLGIIVGFVGANIFSNYARKIKTEMVFNGEISTMSMVYPVTQILISILFIILMLFIISFFTYRKIRKISIIDAIKGNRKNDNINKNLVTVKYLRKYMSTYKAISFKNIFRNKKRFMMIVLSMSICGVILINSNYKNYLSEADDFYIDRARSDNSDIKIDVYGSEDQRYGVSKEDIEKIEKIDGVKEVETSGVINGRMVMEKEDISNKGYFDYLNNSIRGKELFKGYLVTDKINNDLILKQNLRGYNDNALKELEKYLVEGEINIEKIKKEDLAILYIPRVVEEVGKDYVMYNILDNGDPVVNIKVGDTVKFKFREDGKRPESFYTMEDYDAKYIEKEFKVGAIVSYPFMAEDLYTDDSCVDIILSEDNFKEVTGNESYRSININLDDNVDDKSVYREISKISTKTNGAVVRNLVEEKENTKAMYEKSRIYNYGIVAILFIITVVNIINNISQSIIDRTSEFGMLKAVGLNNKDFKKMIVFEGVMYSVASSIIVVIVSFLLNKITYNSWGVESLGIDFRIRYVDYLLVVVVNIIVGYMTTYFPAKKLKEYSIVEMMNITE